MAALLSVWIAFGALITALIVVFAEVGEKEPVVTLLPYTIAFSATLAAGVLWAYRKRRSKEAGVAGRRLQAVAAIAMNSLTFGVLLFWLHGIASGFLGLIVEAAFLALVYWLYTRVLVPD
jgi:hypothetical protein